jgi:hypothetical protein
MLYFVSIDPWLNFKSFINWYQSQIDTVMAIILVNRMNRFLICMIHEIGKICMKRVPYDFQYNLCMPYVCFNTVNMFSEYGHS